MKRLGAMVMLAAALGRSATGAVPSAEKEPEGQVLFDYRSGSSPKSTPRDGRCDKEPSEADRRRIVAAVTKAIVWEGVGEDITINGAFCGSFSKPGARETAYMLQPGGPRAMEPHSMMDTVLAVFSGDRLVAAVPATGSNFIVHAEDVDHDGVDELLIDGSLMTFGVLMTSARLVRLKGRDLKTVHDFGGVYEGACGNEQSMGVRAGVLRYGTPGKDGQPSFRVDVYGAPCRPDGAKPRVEEYKSLPGDRITW